MLKLSAGDGLIVTLCVASSNFFWLPVMGALSDRIGRRPILLVLDLAFLTAYPALSWLAAGPTFSNMLMVELWLSFLYASYNGAMIVALTEVMPAGSEPPASRSHIAWRRPSVDLPRQSAHG